MWRCFRGKGKRRVPSIREERGQRGKGASEKKYWPQ